MYKIIKILTRKEALIYLYNYAKTLGGRTRNSNGSPEKLIIFRRNHAIFVTNICACIPSENNTIEGQNQLWWLLNNINEYSTNLF